MKALVTGGGGFLGRMIVELLISRGDRVRVLGRNKYPELEALEAECIQGDIRSVADCTAACMGVDVVFHVAALAGIWGEAKLFHAINVLGTRNVIEGCKRRGVPKLIYTSSPSVVFNMKDECGITEKTPYPKHHYNIYSRTKAEAERMVIHSSGRDGLYAAALRPHLLWGPRDNHLLPRLIQRHLSGQLRQIGSGENQVDLTFVDNAAIAHLMACDAMSAKRVSGEAYFISDGAPIVLWKWINEFFGQLGLARVERRMSARLAYCAGACLEAAYALTFKREEPPMTRFLSKALSCSHYYDIGKSKRDFGYRPVVSNADGLKRTVDYFRANMPVVEKP